MLFTAVHLPAAAGTLSRRGDRSACCVNRGGRSPAAWRADVHEPNRRTMTALLGQPRPRASISYAGRARSASSSAWAAFSAPVISTPRRVSCSASGSPRLSVPSPATESILFHEPNSRPAIAAEGWLAVERGHSSARGGRPRRAVSVRAACSVAPWVHRFFSCGDLSPAVRSPSVHEPKWPITAPTPGSCWGRWRHSRTYGARPSRSASAIKAAMTSCSLNAAGLPRNPAVSSAAFQLPNRRAARCADGHRGYSLFHRPRALRPCAPFSALPRRHHRGNRCARLPATLSPG